MEERAQGAPGLLVVDDDPRNRLAMTALLEPLGFRLVLASSGEEAITLARSERFSVILVDVRMPGLDGFETVARLREDPNAKRVPIVLLSAFGSESDCARKAYAVGAVDFISKPVDTDLLRAKVASLAEVGRTQPNAEVPGHEVVAAYFRSERASLLKDRLVGIIGHDLRNPLTAITMTAYALLASKNQPEKVTLMAQRILRTAERMGDMVRVILDFTQGELGTGIAIAREPAKMDVICRAIVEENEGLTRIDAFASMWRAISTATGTPTGACRQCRTWSATRSPTARRMSMSSSMEPRSTACACPSTTAASPSRPTSCPPCSSRSGGGARSPTDRGWVLVSTSRERSSPPMGAGSRPVHPRRKGRRSWRCFPERRLTAPQRGAAWPKEATLASLDRRPNRSGAHRPAP